jgi:hypothetical protein
MTRVSIPQPPYSLATRRRGHAWGPNARTRTESPRGRAGLNCCPIGSESNIGEAATSAGQHQPGAVQKAAHWGQEAYCLTIGRAWYLYVPWKLRKRSRIRCRKEGVRTCVHEASAGIGLGQCTSPRERSPRKRREGTCCQEGQSYTGCVIRAASTVFRRSCWLWKTRSKDPAHPALQLSPNRGLGSNQVAHPQLQGAKMTFCRLLAGTGEPKDCDPLARPSHPACLTQVHPA